MRLVVVALCVVGVLGCEVTGLPDAGAGGGSGGGGGSTVRDAGLPLIELGTYCSSVAQATCEAGVRCGFYDSVAGCLSLRESRMAFDACRNGASAVAAGRMRFDGVAARACLLHLASSSCEQGPCSDIFVGQVAVNGACYTFPGGSECTAGDGCDLTQTCPGRCVHLGDAGAVMPSGALCGPGLYGDFRLPDAGFSLSIVTCKPRIPIGGTCDPFNCVEGALCDSETSKCVAPKKENEPCGLSDGGLSLFGTDLCDTPRTGLSCTPSPSGLTCQRGARLNEPCGRCLYDLQCMQLDAGVRRCVPLARVGQRCSGPGTCIDSFCRNDVPTSFFGPGTCAAYIALDQPCGNGEQCDKGLSCTPQLVDGGSVSTCRPVTGVSPATCVAVP